MRSTTKLLLLVFVTSCCCCCCCFSAGIGWPAKRVTYSQWGPWGSCTTACSQFRRRHECTRRGFHEQSCREKYQRKSCLQGPCRQLSANISSFSCGLRDGEQLRTSGSGAWGVVMRIFGGRMARPHSWPWHVNLVHESGSNGHFCGGTLVHPRFVLTAQHCVVSKGKKLTRLFAKVGDHDSGLQPRERWHRVAKVLTHPRLDEGNIEYDMALLMLQQAANISGHVSPACLAGSGQTVRHGDVCTAVGFGRFGPDSEMSTFMREVQLHLLPPSICSREYARTNVRINPSIHICASADGGSDTCSGDSGGGLFCRDPDTGRWFLHGVTSFGHPSGCGNNSGVFQRVAAIDGWIRATVANELIRRG